MRQYDAFMTFHQTFQINLFTNKKLQKSLPIRKMRKVKIVLNLKSSNSDRPNQKRYLTLGKLKANQNLQPLSLKQIHRFYVGPGNNASIIRRILSTRKNWEEVNDPKHIFLNFKWHQSSKSFKYEICVQNKILRNCLNHFEFHHQLSDKQRLFRNLSQYCELHRIDIYEFVPLTFILNFTDSKCEDNLNNFMKAYQSYLPANMKDLNEQGTLFIKKRRKSYNKTIRVNQNQDKGNYLIKNVFLQNQSKYLWILKPTFKNRGNGIHVFNNLLTLQKLINSYITGQHNKPIINVDPQTPSMKRAKSFRIRDYSNQQNDTVRSFVVQKYLQKPLLINGRKFDIRVWVLITHQLKVYFFKQGYIRTSSQKYSTQQATIADNNVHLTNNAVQKQNENYGKFQDGNQLSFKELKNIIENQGHSFSEVINKIKWIIKVTALSVKKKIDKNQRSYCFQIFGYDFMLDQNCKPWLIEVNTNPCIQQSSGLLKTLIPRMLDDAFCLTLDRLFDTQKKGYNYTIENQYSTDNLWQLVIDLKKSSHFSISQQII